MDFVTLLEATRDFYVDRQSFRLWIELLPPSEAESDQCMPPNDHPLTPFNESAFFANASNYQDYAAWGALIGALANYYPHLVALYMDDFTHDIAPPHIFTPELVATTIGNARRAAPWMSFSPAMYARPRRSEFVAATPRRRCGYSRGYESRRRRGVDVDMPVETSRGDAAAATWLYSVATSALLRYYSESSQPFGERWPDILMTVDAPTFYFRNQKEGAGPCSDLSCPWGSRMTEREGGCLAGACAEATSWNVVDEIDDVRAWLPAGRRLLVGSSPGGNQQKGQASCNTGPLRFLRHGTLVARQADSSLRRADSVSHRRRGRRGRDRLYDAGAGGRRLVREPRRLRVRHPLRQGMCRPRRIPGAGVRWGLWRLEVVFIIQRTGY